MPLPAVTLQRVEKVLKQEELDYEYNGDEVLTGFVNANFAYRILEETDLLFIYGFWRAVATDPQDIQNLITAVRNLNADSYLPRWVATTMDDGEFRIRYEYSAPVAAGLSDEQLSDVITAMFGMTLSTLRGLEEEFPHLVTWKETEGE